MIGIERIDEVTVNVMTTLYREQVVKWIKELKSFNSYPKSINIAPLQTPIRKFMSKVFMLSYLQAYYDVNQEVERQLSSTKNFQSLGGVHNSGFDEAIRWLRNKTLVTPEQFKRAVAEIKAVTFSVQRLERLNLIEAIQMDLIDAIDQGLDFKDWKANVNQTFEKYGVTPLTNHHLQTVYRTNIHQSYNMAHRQASVQNKAVEAMRYMAISDKRTTPFCESMNEQVFPKDDPIWNDIMPPNHYLCRSRTMPVTGSYMKAKGWEYSDKPTNDVMETQGKDFTNSPKDFKAYDKMLQKTINERQASVNKLQDQLRDKK